jgi:hypothetical protein
MPLTKRNAAREANKLAYSESGWNLTLANTTTTSTTTRTTRGGGNGRPNLARYRESELDDEEEEQEEDEAQEEQGAVAGATATSRRPPKPGSTRVLLDVKNVEEAIEQLLCPGCLEPAVAKAPDSLHCN